MGDLAEAGCWWNKGPAGVVSERKDGRCGWQNNHLLKMSMVESLEPVSTLPYSTKGAIEDVIKGFEMGIVPWII